MSEPIDYLAQIQKLNPRPGDLLVIYPETWLTLEQHERVIKSLSPFAESMGCRVLVTQPGLQVSLQSDPAALLAEMRKQTSILEAMAEQQAMMVQALADGEEEDPDTQPRTYMDGTLCR
ncbi:hypothetical protein [Pseudomonas fluorescens]|uniref:Uncharacterized protein n=1 Tax=Pseudomonas fluorescens TaxID=294 RepID=A0A5E7AD07_PSEFL|nr:hypothetical protein [Pseudomonas fluorescens]VVN74187.1 hypothetical protein PS710_00634 [Pseudomonas fluorescens]